MPRRSAPALGLRTFARLLAPGVVGALALLILGARHLPVALASSGGTVVITPSSGPVGTSVEADINLSPDTPQAYTLEATSTDPAQGGCAKAQPIPGVGPVTVGQQGGHAQFPWPAAFASGQYWLCASPQGGSGPTVPSAHSLQPYTVTAADAPTPSPTPLSGGHLDQSHTYVDAQDGIVTAGSTVTVTVTGWVTPDNAAPSVVNLVLPDNSTVGVPFTIGPKSSPQDGSYALAVTVPATTAPGSYYFEIGGAYQAVTAPFQVVAPVSPTATPIVARGQPIPASGSGIPPIAIGIAVAALLLLAVLLLVASLRGRKRSDDERPRDPRDRGGDYATRHLADGYGMRHQREEMRRR